MTRSAENTAPVAPPELQVNDRPALAPLDSAALGPGVVTVKSYRKTVQHLEGGIVRELRVPSWRWCAAS